MKQLGELGEDAIVKRLIEQLRGECPEQGNIVAGPGDDCAVVDLGQRGRYQLLKTDCIVEGVHYLSNTPAAKVGWKAIARVISDFAAMGGMPSHLLVTIAMPAGQSIQYLEKLYQGMQKCASRYGATICGGETSAVPTGSSAVISVAGTGWVEKSRCIMRGGGKAGDLVLVTGRLGGSIGGKHLTFVPRIEEARWLGKHFRIRSMMDLSDGLGSDLPRLAEASQCGYLLHENALPRNRGCSESQALADGEDYELLLSVSPRTVGRLQSEWAKKFPSLLLSVVGELTRKDAGGGSNIHGWEHFEPN